VRTAGEPASLAGAIRRAAASIDRNLVLTDVKTQTRQIEESLHQERLFATLLTFFGLFSLLLAAIGLHGVAAYTAARRTPEIGLRLALGAGRANIFGLVFRQVLVPVAGGIAVGLAASWSASHAIESMLFGIERLDAATVATVLGLLAAVALASAFLPAWRAAHLDAMTALRTE
jgi:ABC-type antimicrobial peptide transport system permease subunit